MRVNKQVVKDEHRYNGVCKLLTPQELLDPFNNVCNKCRWSIGTERNCCSHNEEFELKVKNIKQGV